VSRLLVRQPGTTSAQIAVLFTPRRSLSAATTGTVTATATFPASGTSGPGSSFPGVAAATGTVTPPPIGPTLPASPGESLPPPEIVNLSRWAIADGPAGDSQT
jgi:hypothetical protein